MTPTLALKYRPRTFADIVGQKSVKLVLNQMVKQHKVPTGILFSGVRGTGKTSTGRILAAALNCEAPTKPCSVCPHCKAIFGGNSLDVLEIDAASNGGVEDIRKLTESLRYSVGGNTRIVLLDEAHSMSRDANNALLKTLEEPPADTVFILLTTEPGKLIDTVISRLMGFEFRRISTQDIVDRLKYIVESEGFEVQPELLTVLAERANGGLRDAVMTLDQITRVGVVTVDEFADMMGETDYAPAIVKAMVVNDLSTVFALVDEQLSRSGDSQAVSSALINLFRDLLIIHSGGEVARQGEALQQRKELSVAIESDRVVAALRVLWDLKTKVRFDDPRAILDLSAVMIVDQLGGKAKQRVASGPPKRMTLAEMQQM